MELVMEPIFNFTETLLSGTILKIVSLNLFITEPKLRCGEIMEIRSQWLNKT